MRRAAVLWSVLVCLAAPAAAEVSRAGVSIGVAPFEGVAAPGAVLPDLATLLADRLAQRGAARVVGPSQLGAAPTADPTPEQVRAWAEAADVRSVVVGRTTKLDAPLRVEVRLHAAATGKTVDTFSLEVAGDEELAAAIDGLAARLVERSAAIAVSEPTAASAGPTGPEGGGQGQARFGLALDRKEPLSIRSDELEAFQNGGARRLVFKQNVVVTQSDLRITTNRLEAYYPPDANQPDRLLASGQVVVVQGDQEARCDEAAYDRGAQSLVCRGRAELREGDDRVSGETIQFDLARETVVVTGGAAVLFHPGAETDAETDPAGDADVSIGAEEPGS